ncbi:MAG: carboxypeptidase M32 [Candidatus Bathyarchaeota archaeon]|nr:MAG: carboxypeptidase M32 [Candidatus Bathyarchaeota archaeon]
MSTSISSSYKKLLEKTKDLTIFGTAIGVLHWDMETKMPPQGIQMRSQQLAMLSKIGHKMATNPEIGKLLNQISNHPDYSNLDLVQKRNLYLIKKDYDEQTKLPEKLVVETSKQTAITVDVWKKAKAKSDFSKFKPELQKLLDLKKQSAQILMEVKQTNTAYDAMIDIFEPHMTSDVVSKVFNKLREGLVSVLQKCESSTKQPDTSILNRQVPTELQTEIARLLASFIGYDVESPKSGGRIDETEHPFTTGYYDDVRITTHYYLNKFATSVFSVLHEGGHALYEQNLKPEWMYQPVGTACSMGFHESQSRFVENIVGRSMEFWSHFLPTLKKVTGSTLSDLKLENFVHAINHVHSSKIRVEADEVTYGLHVIIRFNLEQDLFADKISVDELPQIWNENYNKYLGVTIKNDSEGVMQDTHWASGLYGYFPSYALGNIYSGQLMDCMEKQIQDWRTQISEGKFQNVKNWLIKHVHSYGNLYNPPELIQKITETDLNVEPFLNYLNQKYSQLYQF